MTYKTHSEIKTQPEAWAQALQRTRSARLPNPADYEQVIFTGCGSTYYLSLAGAALYQELTGRPARAIPGGELLLNGQSALTNGKTLLVAASRSGTTTETARAAEMFKREGHGDLFVISNYDEILSKQADFQIVIEAGQEESVAQTRSFASMYVAVTAACARMAQQANLLNALDKLAAAGLRLMERYEARARALGEDLSLDRIYFLGSGIRYGLACEANLKMKEMTLTHSEPFHFLEFRHGPMSMVTPQTLMVGLLSEKNFSHEQAVLNEMQAKGAQVFALAESGTQVTFDSGIPEAGRAVLYLPLLQLMAYYRALAKSLNPDRPRNLTAVIKLEL